MAETQVVETVEGQDPANGAPDAPEVFGREYVEQLRKEAAGYRVRMKELESKVDAFEKEKLGDRERLQAELDAAKKEREALDGALRQERARVAIVQAAAKHGIAPELAERLVDVEFDADGAPVGVDEALKKLAATYPHLVQPGGGSAPTNPQKSKATMLTAEEIKRMSPEEINRRWDEVSAALSASKGGDK